MAWTGELAELLPGRVELGEAERSGAAGDMSPLRQMAELRGVRFERPAAVARPACTADVQAVMRFAGDRGLHVIARGGGSGVVGAIAATAGDIVLDLRNLSGIGPVDRESGLVTVQAGCILETLEEQLAASGLTLGHYPQSIALASLGGLIATRSSGQYSTWYGNIEDMVAGIEVVTADGEATRFGRLPRRSLGPEVWPLFVGSEGTLGVITAVTLSAWPLPSAQEVRSYAFRDFRQGLRAMRQVTRKGLPLGVIRLYDRDDAMHGFAGVLPEEGVDALLLLSCLGEAEVVAGGVAAADRIVSQCDGLAMPEAIGRHWLAARNDVSEWGMYLAQGVLVDTIECGAAWSAIADVYEAAIEAVRQVPEVVAAFGHAAHAEASGAGLYFTVAAVPAPGREAAEAGRRIWDALLGAAAAKGASVGHHHGVGRMRRAWAWRERREELAILESLRTALDPGRVLNPGVLWPDP